MPVWTNALIPGADSANLQLVPPPFAGVRATVVSWVVGSQASTARNASNVRFEIFLFIEDRRPIQRSLSGRITRREIDPRRGTVLRGPAPKIHTTLSVRPKG